MSVMKQSTHSGDVFKFPNHLQLTVSPIKTGDAN